MSSFDKVVKLACKPKAAPPKAKYLDPIIAATWSEDGAVHDVCKALSPRFKEPNAIVVFKALIVLHTMIRNGATDNVLSYLSSSEVLRLRNVSAGSWDGYSPPENLQNYAVYLDSRIHAYHDLKHDAIRVQAETNRDMRNNNSIDEDTNNSYKTKNRGKAPPAPTGPTRSKTVMGRKLRVMTVEKGLLRETRAVHKMIDTLVECRFYLDDLEDELTTTALRMLVKDLLILFQAGNEGVINLLEHYFEMSHLDAEEALRIYRHFCKQTERVVEYLGVAKKLQNLLNVPVPNLKHAPVSLAGALQEYLDDPNFEQNRIEYKTNKEAAERGNKRGANGSKASSPKPKETPPPLPVSPPSASAAPQNTKSDAVVDFFQSIEEAQPTMFNPQTNSPNSSYFQLQGASNPFHMVGQQQPPQLQVHPTGFVIPQQPTFQQPSPNPFGLSPQPRLQPQPTGHRPFSSFLPNQSTGFLAPQQQMQPQQTNFLQPQATGSNPFRQSMLMPQTTGMAMFGVGGGGGGGMVAGMQSQQHQQQPTPSPFQAGFPPGQLQSGSMMASGAFGGQMNGVGPPGQQQQRSQQQLNGSMMSNPTGPSSAFSSSPSFGGIGVGSVPSNMPPRPASTPLTLVGASTAGSGPSPPVAQPVKTHQTGTRNPFGPISAPPPPPVPKAPTLMEIALGYGNTGQNGSVNGQTQMQQMQQQQRQQQLQQQQTPTTGAFAFGSSALNPGATDMSSIASSFRGNTPSDTNKPNNAPSFSSFNTLPSQNTATTTTGSISDSLFSSTLSSQPTGMTNASLAPSIAPVKSHLTGMAGLKPFKPSSSFGASLLESLPPIPGSSPATPAVTGLGNDASTPSEPPKSGFTSSLSPPGNSGMNSQPMGMGALNSQPTGFGQPRTMLGQGLRPQMTGGGAANPFRMTMALDTPSNFGGRSFSAGNSLFPTSATQPSFTGAGGAFGSSLFGVGTPNGGNLPQQQQQQQSGSLI